MSVDVIPIDVKFQFFVFFGHGGISLSVTERRKLLSSFYTFRRSPSPPPSSLTCVLLIVSLFVCLVRKGMECLWRKRKQPHTWRTGGCNDRPTNHLFSLIRKQTKETIPWTYRKLKDGIKVKDLFPRPSIIGRDWKRSWHVLWSSHSDRLAPNTFQLVAFYFLQKYSITSGGVRDEHFKN